MEYVLLAKVGFFIKVITSLGYAVAGGYVASTGVRYVKDYKNSTEQEEGV